MKRRKALQKFPAFNKSGINFILPYHHLNLFIHYTGKLIINPMESAAAAGNCSYALNINLFPAPNAMHKKLRRVEITR